MGYFPGFRWPDEPLTRKNHSNNSPTDEDKCIFILHARFYSPLRYLKAMIAGDQNKRPGLTAPNHAGGLL
jgi:hypothetical protein